MTDTEQSRSARNQISLSQRFLSASAQVATKTKHDACLAGGSKNRLFDRERQGKIFVISGPSGSGKTTLLKNLLRDTQLKRKITKSVSFTTRPQRTGEKHGEDYYFISEKEFKEKCKAKKILEWTRYLGYYYGTAKDFLESQLYKSAGIVLCLDQKGCQRIKQFYPENTVTIFIIPSSLEELSERIQKRCQKTKKEEIQKRLKLARKEILVSSGYNYRIVNKDLPGATRELKNIINTNLR